LKPWYDFRAQARGAEIVIYDEIGGFGIPANAFLDELKTVGPVAELTLRINSPGRRATSHGCRGLALARRRALNEHMRFA
jgi:hypothetical protein